MAEIFKADGEGIPDIIPWDFDSVQQSGNGKFRLRAEAAIRGVFGYEIVAGAGSWGALALKVLPNGPYFEVYARFHLVLLASLYCSTSAGWPILMLRSSGGSILQTIGINWPAGGEPVGWNYYDPNTGGVDDATGFSLNAEHYLELHYKKGAAGSSSLEWRVNGQLLGSYSPNSPTEVDNIHFGKWDVMGVNITEGLKVYVDELLLATTGWIGIAPIPSTYKPQSGLPAPFVDYVPKIFRDNPSPDLLALTGKMDELIGAWGSETKELQHLYDPARAQEAALEELGFMFQAGFKGYETEREKRQKIGFAVRGHKSRGLWQEDAKPKIDAIAGGDAQILKGFSGDDWILVGDGLTPPAYYWASLGADGIDDDLGIALIGAGDEVEIAGNIYIDVDNDSLTAQEVENMVQELETDVVPAYIRVILGYVNVAGQFIEYVRI